MIRNHLKSFCFDAPGMRGASEMAPIDGCSRPAMPFQGSRYESAAPISHSGLSAWYMIGWLRVWRQQGDEAGHSNSVG